MPACLPSPGLEKMEGDHDGDPRELSRLPAPFPSRTITVIATISRATHVAGIMPLEAGMLFRLILMPSSLGEVPTWPKATCRDQGWRILSAQGRTPRSGARPRHIATMVTKLELGLGEGTRMHNGANSGPWGDTAVGGGSRETQPGHLTPPGPAEKPGL